MSELLTPGGQLEERTAGQVIAAQVGWQQDTLNVAAGAPQGVTPFGYVTPDGAARVVYRDVNANITELYLTPGQHWQSDTLNVAAGGAPQAASAPFGYVTPDGTARVIYQDVNSNITELYLTPGQHWQSDTLNVAAGGAPQAASAPSGYVTPDGTARVIYRDVNANITELYLTPGQHWQSDTLNVAAGGAPQAASAPSGYVTPDGTARVIYRDVNANITELYLTPGQHWQSDTLNVAAGGAPQAASAPSGYVTPDGTARVIYRDVNANITELYLTPGQHWQSDTLNVAAGGAPQAASAPFGYVTPDGAARVIYQDVNSNITDIYLAPGRPWVFENLSGVAGGAPQAASAPSGYVTPDGTARVIYRDVNANITELYLTPGQHWQSDTLNVAAGGAPQAASAPFGYVTPDGAARVIYQDVNSNITDIYLAPGRPWVFENLSGVAGGAPQAASAPSGYVTPDGTARVIYRDVNANITELYLTPGQHWQSDTLNVAAGGAPQAASAPSGYVTPDGTARLIYRDVNANITELYLTPGQHWQSDTLNVAA